MHGQILSNDPFLLQLFLFGLSTRSNIKMLRHNDEALNYVFELKEDNQQHQNINEKYQQNIESLNKDVYCYL